MLRTSGWGVAESWAPCAIGMMPCDKSPTGRAPNTVLEPTTVAASELPQSRDPAMQPQHSRLAGSEAQVRELRMLYKSSLFTGIRSVAPAAPVLE